MLPTILIVILILLPIGSLLVRGPRPVLLQRATAASKERQWLHGRALPR
jgi:hypothetical protein